MCCYCIFWLNLAIYTFRLLHSTWGWHSTFDIWGYFSILTLLKIHFLNLVRAQLHKWSKCCILLLFLLFNHCIQLFCYRRCGYAPVNYDWSLTSLLKIYCFSTESFIACFFVYLCVSKHKPYRIALSFCYHNFSPNIWLITVLRMVVS